MCFKKVLEVISVKESGLFEIFRPVKIKSIRFQFRNIHLARFPKRNTEDSLLEECACRAIDHSTRFQVTNI